MRSPVVIAIAIAIAASSASAQTLGHRLVGVNSDAEQYLRLLQVAGLVRPEAWTIREFGPREVDRLVPPAVGHPFRWLGRPQQSAHVDWIVPTGGVVYNSTYPWGYNDGPVWAGRGATIHLRAGAAFRTRFLTVVLDPMVFAAENRPFTLGAAAAPGADQFHDLYEPDQIDLPQRFGDHAYGRFDPGESSVRLDIAGLAIGGSTAAQHIGPATTFPYLLGNNAPGLPRVFIGTSAPLDLGIGRIHGRMAWARGDRTEWSTKPATDKRLITSFAASFQPGGLPGLEIGGARLFHIEWPANGFTQHDYLRPLEGLFKRTVARERGTESGDEPDNQLASMFFRWVIPTARLEVFGEFGRDDHNLDARDAIVEVDNDATYMVGLQRVLAVSDDRLSYLRAEVLTSRMSHLDTVRNQVLPYIHPVAAQGHTARGQILGAPGAAGGGGFSLRAGTLTPRGGWSLGLVRLLGCGGTGGTRSCDAMAVEVSNEWRRSSGLSTQLALSAVNRQEQLYSDRRVWNVGLQSSIR